MGGKAKHSDIIFQMIKTTNLPLSLLKREYMLFLLAMTVHFCTFIDGK